MIELFQALASVARKSLKSLTNVPGCSKRDFLPCVPVNSQHANKQDIVALYYLRIVNLLLGSLSHFIRENIYASEKIDGAILLVTGFSTPTHNYEEVSERQKSTGNRI